MKKNTFPLTPKAQTFLKKYIELDTSRADGKYYPTAIALLSSYLAEIGFECSTLAMPTSITKLPNRVHLIARKFVAMNLPTLVIYNHIDVVPAQYDTGFTFSYDETKIHGRGACDHKGSTAVIISALERLKQTMLRFNLVFLATTDEETDQKTQLEFLSSKLNLTQNTLIFDPDTFAGGVTVAHLGCLQLDVTIHGKSAHSAASHLGINAIERTQLVLQFFADEKKRQEQIKSNIAPFPSSQATAVSARCNVNMIKGGSAVNVIPDICHLSVDYRFVPEQDVQTEKEQIFVRFEKFCHQHQLTCKLESKVQFEGYVSDHPEADTINSIYQQFDTKSGKYCVMGSTPAADWAKQLQLPHFGIGVARGDTRMHSDHEFAYIEDMVSLEKTIIEFLQK